MKRLKDAWIEVYYVYYRESIYSPLAPQVRGFRRPDRHHRLLQLVRAEPLLRRDPTVMRDEEVAAAYMEEAEIMLRSFRIEGNKAPAVRSPNNRRT